jgi:hypothetical protein
MLLKSKQATMAVYLRCLIIYVRATPTSTSQVSPTSNLIRHQRNSNPEGYCLHNALYRTRGTRRTGQRPTVGRFTFERRVTLSLPSRDHSCKVFGKEHPSVAASLNNLAGLLEAQGRRGGAPVSAICSD